MHLLSFPRAETWTQTERQGFFASSRVLGKSAHVPLCVTSPARRRSGRAERNQAGFGQGGTSEKTLLRQLCSSMNLPQAGARLNRSRENARQGRDRGAAGSPTRLQPAGHAHPSASTAARALAAPIPRLTRSCILSSAPSSGPQEMVFPACLTRS